jgi:predicted nucleic acid-binding protein
VILLDTSILIDGFTSDQRLASHLRRAIEKRERMVISTLVLYEWLRGPRLQEELDLQEALFPSGQALPFGPEDAALSAKLYRTVQMARGREIDLAIAATAINHGARLWTLNRADFADVPGLNLYSPR